LTAGTNASTRANAEILVFEFAQARITLRVRSNGSTTCLGSASGNWIIIQQKLLASLLRGGVN
jgi:hypothetical protein